ncbi:hypothetical protein PAPYR_4587 [Paratrimastix pyriformis]|uniref:Uncharacterized protein n=1 Tax=Paratrimastix pyriformis TaxID=342808 RepID=A0ABQ8UP88_9EUKA|nr:hypothetical protein PAPYR_4587 [Paratrimastix pyriformis]
MSIPGKQAPATCTQPSPPAPLPTPDHLEHEAVVQLELISIFTFSLVAPGIEPVTFGFLPRHSPRCTTPGRPVLKISQALANFLA